MERDFATLNKDVVFKKAGGKIIWQPRIQCWIADKIFADGKLPGEYEGLDEPDIFRKLNCSARPYDFNGCFQEYFLESSGIKRREVTEGEKTTFYIETPVGTVTHIQKSTKSSWARLVVKEWVCNEEDLKIMTYIESQKQYSWNQEFYEAMLKKWGNLGAPAIFMPRVSVQKLYIDLMGVEEAVYAFADYEETVIEFFTALRESHFRMIDVINQSPIMLINFGDNIHSGTLSPTLFEKYVLKEYQLRCERLHKAGKFVYSHYDGNNRGLMEYYQQTGLDGIEAITPVPQGDVTLEEVREHLGDNMFLIDGIPAVYFDEIYPVETLIECVEKIIDLFAPNLVLGISDEISSTGDIERVRLISDIVDNYNKKFE